MQIAVRQDDEAAILRPRIFAGLLLADERNFIFRFCLKDDEREPSGIEQQKIDKPLRRFLEVVAAWPIEVVDSCLFDASRDRLPSKPTIVVLEHAR